MGKTNRLQKRFLEREGKKVMENAMVEKAKSIAVEERQRAFAWKRAAQLMFVVILCMGVALVATIYTSVQTNYLLKEAKEKCAK